MVSGDFKRTLEKDGKKKGQVDFGIAQMITDVFWMEGASSDTGPATHGRSYMFHWQISIWVSKDRHANINSFRHYPVYHQASCTLVNFSTWLAV